MNPVALITGGSRGIGRGIALELSGIGYDLILNYVSNKSAAEATASDCARRAKDSGHSIAVNLFQTDVGVAAERSRLLQFVQVEHGRLDLLVNNAGIAPAVRCDVLDTSRENFEQVMRTNLEAPFFLTQEFARWLIESPQPAGRFGLPKVVFIGSVSAYTASINRGEYCVAKAGLSMVTKLFAERLAPHGINVYEVRPGVIATDMTASVKDKYNQKIQEGLTPICRWGLPEDVGRAVAAIGQGSLAFSTGEVLNVDGGFHLHRL